MQNMHVLKVRFTRNICTYTRQLWSIMRWANTLTVFNISNSRITKSNYLIIYFHCFQRKSRILQ